MTKLTDLGKELERGLDGLRVVPALPHEKVELVELLPHRAAEHLATLTGVLPGVLQAR